MKPSSDLVASSEVLDDIMEGHDFRERMALISSVLLTLRQRAREIGADRLSYLIEMALIEASSSAEIGPVSLDQDSIDEWLSSLTA